MIKHILQIREENCYEKILMKTLCISMFLSTIISIICTNGFAANITQNKISPEEYLEDVGFEYPEDYKECDVFIGEISLMKSNFADATISDVLINEEIISIPAVVVRTVDENDIITDSVTYTLVENANQELISALSITSDNKLLYSSEYNAISPQDSSGGSYTKDGITVTLSASYTKVNLVQYDIGGYGYAPSYAYYKFVNNTSNAVTNCNFQTYINSLQLLDSSDPTIIYDDEDIFQYYRSYISDTPLMNYQYSFNELPYYRSQGFLGKLFHITYAYGAYIIEAKFDFGGYEYTAFYEIQNSDGNIEKG